MGCTHCGSPSWSSSSSTLKLVGRSTVQPSSLNLFGFYQPSLIHACADRKPPQGKNLDVWPFNWTFFNLIRHFWRDPSCTASKNLDAKFSTIRKKRLESLWDPVWVRLCCPELVPDPFEPSQGNVTRYKVYLMMADTLSMHICLPLLRGINQKGAKSKHIFICHGACTCMWVHVCVSGLCSSVSLVLQHSDSTCLDSMQSRGPAHCSQTLLLLFTTLAVEWKTPACLSTCRLISRHSLSARKHVFNRKFSGKTRL